jgi:hypothetical protein
MNILRIGASIAAIVGGFFTALPFVFPKSAPQVPPETGDNKSSGENINSPTNILQNGNGPTNIHQSFVYYATPPGVPPQTEPSVRTPPYAPPLGSPLEPNGQPGRPSTAAPAPEKATPADTPHASGRAANNRIQARNAREPKDAVALQNPIPARPDDYEPDSYEPSRALGMSQTPRHCLRDQSWSYKTDKDLGKSPILSTCTSGRFFAFQCVLGKPALITDAPDQFVVAKVYSNRGHRLEGYDQRLHPQTLDKFTVHFLELDDYGEAQSYIFQNAGWFRLEDALGGHVNLPLLGVKRHSADFPAVCWGGASSKTSKQTSPTRQNGHRSARALPW